MADVDLFREAYRSKLGRDASDDELQGWTSGTYGGGSVQDRLNQIASSPEAQAYRPAQRNQTDGTVVGQNPNVSTPQTPDTPAQTNSDPQAKQIADWYQQYLGRSGGQDDLTKWLSGAYGWGSAGNMAGIESGIKNSEEAARRRAATPTSSYSSTPYTGFNTRGNDYSAFNMGRLQEPGKSAKDAFAMITNQAPPPPFHNKAAMGQWFSTYIRPGMESLGHRVTSVTEDGFTFTNHEGTFFVDFGQNSGAAAGSMQQRLQWNASPADEATRARYAGGGGAAGVPGGSTGAAGQSGAVQQTPGPSFAGALTPFVPIALPPPDPQRGIIHQFDANSQHQIAQWYQQYLGRNPGVDDFLAHASNPGNLPGIELAIKESPEAKAFAARPTTTTQTGTQTGGNTQTGGGNAQTTGGGQGAPYGMPGTQFNDPHTQYLEKLLQQMIQSRMSPVNDPNRMMYEQAMKDRATALGQGNQQLDQLMAYLQTRFQELQGNGYTSAEGEAIRTGALDPIENDRQAARKRVMERLSARGLTPDSGIAQQALLEVDKAFDAMRGTTQNTLTINDLNRREDRKVRAQNIGTQLVDIPQARAREQLDVFGALNQLSQLARQENEAREREAVGYGGALADLGPQRLQLAMQAAGMGGNPSSMFGNLMQLAGLNQNAAMYGAQNQSQLWSGLGSLAAMLANSGR